MSKEGSVAPKERINIRYIPALGDENEEVELPLNMMVIGDFRGCSDETAIEDRNPINIDKDKFNKVLEGFSPTVQLNIENRLIDEENTLLALHLTFKKLKDFSPESIAQNVPELKSLLDLREALVALKGPLGNMPAFRKRISALLEDTETRNKLLDELNLAHDKNA